MNPEEHFLQDATHGLRGNVRREAQAELRSHLHERVHQLIEQGTPEAAARAQALGELGSPRRIAHGLVRQHGVHPAVMWSAFGVATVMAVLTGLTSLYVGVSDGSLSRLDQLFVPTHSWISPCENRPRCIPIFSETELTATDYWTYGLVPVGQATEVFAGTDVRISGLFRKTVAFPGGASLPLNDHLFEVGRDGHRGRQRGVLNLSGVLLAGAQQGWPVQIGGSGSTLDVTVHRKTLNADSVRLAAATMSEYLRQQMNLHLAGRVQQAADAAARASSMTSSPVQPFAWASPNVPRPTRYLAVTAPGRAEHYAVVLSEVISGDSENAPRVSLTAFQVVPDEQGQLRVPVQVSGGETNRAFDLVNSQAHFLHRVATGRNVAMLVKVPRDLKLGTGFQVAPVQERSLNVQ
ncbi:permease prefix domain 1-containing protein [uncultured Deinococcus sp.]|uniref:permease prefix domain 1-containing protein n=1 Tax=uncultured Deinococcus sp. TaxID=158789 RepID=UPI0026009131|nr:permease prefix domain 1-containing protein [uncultured Deinococcus sp.]